LGYSLALVGSAAILARSTRFDGRERTFVVVVMVLCLLLLIPRTVVTTVKMTTLRPIRIDAAGVRSGDRRLEWAEIQDISLHRSSVLRRLRSADPNVTLVSSQGNIEITHDHVDDLSRLLDLLKAEAVKHGTTPAP
jgi:hypothetical protein